MAAKKKRMTFKERCRKTLKEWSFYLMVAALALGSAPELIPHLDGLLSRWISEGARHDLQELLMILSIASRFVPQSVRHTVEEHRND